MFRHIVLFTLGPDAPADAASTIAATLRGLPAQIPEIRSYVVGLDAGHAAGNADVSVIAGFDDAAGWMTYRDHPDHRKVLDEQITPVLASRVAIQFEE